MLSAYWVFTLTAWFCIRYGLMSRYPSFRPYLRKIWFGEAVLLTLLLIFLNMFPPDPAHKWVYTGYTWFNAILLTDFTCKTPLFISGLLMMASRRVRFRCTVWWMGIILSSGLGITFLWGILAGPGMCVNREITLKFPALPPAFKGMKIVQISDAHFGTFHNKAMMRKMVAISGDFRPDLVVFTGDLVNNYAWEANGWSTLLAQFHGSLGKYGVLGNHDYGDYSRWPSPSVKEKNFREIVTACEVSGFRVLRNETVKLAKEGDTLYLTGVENWGHTPFPRYADLSKASENMPDGSFGILLSHDPAHWHAEACHDKRYALTLSGHTHGLQWGLIMAGIRFSLIWLLEPYWGGLYRNDDRYLYVNGGLGMIGMHLRLDMPAEITLITLTGN
mgnify:CR=1 FL=1